MSYFNYNNKYVYYKEFGTGIPLIFLHGNTASSNMFEGIAEKYSKYFKVVLIDFLGHGKSDRLSEFPVDLWFEEAQQVIAFIHERHYEKVNIIGSSGGALVAINVALESPEIINKVIADSFEGEKPVNLFTENIKTERELSKQDEKAKMFYTFMHGSDWEHVVDNDTEAIIRHEKEIGVFFHKPLTCLKADILLTGSDEDEFISALSPDYFRKVYGEMIEKIGHGKIHLFSTGGHPAMLSNSQEFYQLSIEFFQK